MNSFVDLPILGLKDIASDYTDFAQKSMHSDAISLDIVI